MRNYIPTTWTNLATNVETATSIEDAIVMANLDWEVKRQPVLFDNKKTGHDFIYREDTNKLLAITSSSYNILQNKEAFSFFDVFLHEGEATLENAIALKDGKRIAITVRLNVEPVEIVAGSTVMPYLILANSHDRSLSVTIKFSNICHQCWNTLSPAIANAKKNGELEQLMKIRHTTNMHTTLDNTKVLLDIYGRKFKQSVDVYKELATRNNNANIFKDYCNKVFKMDDVEDSKNWDKLWQIYVAGIGADNTALTRSFYWCYQVIAEYTAHHIRAKNVENRLDANWFGGGAAIRDRALQVAVDMAKTLPIK